MKSINERGKFKQAIKSMLFMSDDVKKVLFGDERLTQEQAKEKFNMCVKSHFFIDDTLTEKGSYIFFDVVIPNISTQIKDCKIVMYLISHREILDDYSLDGYYGNRADILSQTVENALLNTVEVKEFGIGDLQLDSVDIYNSANYYGVQMLFSTSCFR